MKFVHIADVHLDIPFKTISDRADLGTKRRLEQRQALKDVIQFIKENNIEYLFISGDLYENEYIRESSIEYLNNLFKEIPNTKIYIAPGNHDPNIKNSYYNTFSWASNVKIFTNRVEKVENSDANIYGYGFNDFEMLENKLEEIENLDKNKINILITHGDLSESIYNPVKKADLIEKDFDYIALGHIHKRDDKTNIVYPGSLISLGFDELGEHGMIVGEIINKELNKKFIKADNAKLIVIQSPIFLFFMVNNKINFKSHKIFYVPYKVINNEAILKCVKVDKVYINSKEVNVLLGLIDESVLKNSIDIILNENIRGEITC